MEMAEVKDGRMVIDLTVQTDSHDRMKMLLQRGAVISGQNKYGEPLLFL